MESPPVASHLIDILVVDDFPDAAESLGMLLEIEGYTVRKAFSAREALEAIEVSVPLCVLLDITMPGMDGLDLARQLRAKFGDDVILVAITGNSATAPRVSETFALVDHYFVKPIQASDLRKIFLPRSAEKIPHTSED